MIDQKQVELLIRARLKGQEDISAITKSIAKLGEVITQQADAAKRGESSYEGLKAAISALEAESKKLDARRGALKYFEGLEGKAASAQAKIDNLTKQYAELNATVKASGTVGTERQVAQLQRLNKQIENQKGLLTGFRNDQANLGEALRKVGVDADNVAGALAQIDVAVLGVSTAIDRGNRELAEYADNLTRGREAARQLADAQSKLARLQEGNVTDARVGRQQQLEAEARAAKKTEQAEADLLALRQRAGKADQAAQGKTQADSELAALRDSEAFVKRINEQKARDAALFAAAEKKADDARRARAEDYSSVLSVQARRAAENATARRKFDEEAAAQRRSNQLDELRRDIEARSQQSAAVSQVDARDTGLRKAADDATAAAKGYSTLARASTDLRPRIVSLREAVDAINDPAKASRKTLAGVEEQINAVTRAVSQAKGPLKDASDQLRSLQSAKRALSEQGGLVDAYQRQIAVLRDQRTEFTAARAEVAKYAAAVRAGGDAGAAFVKPLTDAQSRLKAASVAMREQVVAASALRENLRSAGINTSALADAQRRMTDSARAGAKAAHDLAVAAERQAEASGKGAKGFSLFRDEGRTTLSLLQRIRGELLAMAAAYIGLQGAISLARDSLKAYIQAEGLRNTLAFAQNVQADSAQIGAEIEYLRQQSERLGVSFEFASKGYASFSTSVLKSGGTIKEARFIFESLSEVGRVINLAPDQIERLFIATGQSFNKGKIQAEELIQQIGERLPGAFAFAQEALRDKFPNLQKALEQGKVGAENMVIIMESVRRAAAAQLPAAIKSLDAEQQRFNNSVLFFKKEIADAGFAQAYIALLKQMTQFLSSDEGKKFAQDISTAFEAAIVVAQFLLRNIKEVSAVLIGIGTYVGLAVLVGTLGKLAAAWAILSPIVIAFGTALLAANAATSFAALAMGVVSKALLGVLAAYAAFKAGFTFGSYLYENSQSVRVFAAEVVTTFAKLWTQLKAAAETFWSLLPTYAENAARAMLNLFNNVFVRPFVLVLRDIGKAAGLLPLVDAMDSLTRSLSLDLKETTNSRVQEIAANLKRDLATIEDIRKGMLVDAKRAPAAAAFRPSQNYGDGAGTTPFPGARPGKPTAANEGEINKRKTEIEALEKALDALDNKIDRKNKDVLSDQLAVVDREFAAMAKRIAELGGKEAIGFAKRLSEAHLDLRAQTEDSFNKRHLDSLEGLLVKVEAAESAAGRKRKTDLEAQLDAIKKSYAQMYSEIETRRAIIQDNRGDTGAVDALRARLQLAEADAKASAGKEALNRQLAEREQQINNIVDARAAKLKAIDDQAVAGVITRSEADRQQLEVIAQMQPLIDGMALSGQSFANAMQGALDPTKLQEFIDKLNLVTGSGARLNAELDRTGKLITEGIGKGVDTTLAAAYDSLVLVAQGSATWGDAFETAGRAILQTLAQILKEIAITIIKEQILIQIQLIRKALSGASGNLSESATGAAVFHSGGLVGATANRTRTVSPAWFANAPRYHAGGVVGIQPGEYPAILQKNEEVLSNSDPRNVLNGSLKGGNAAQPQAQRFVLVDDRSRVAEAMAGAEGEEVTMIHLRKNIPTLRSLIKGA